MTLKVPGTILARSENSDPLCGPTMENARIFNTHHGSKRPIMDPLNHAQLLRKECKSEEGMIAMCCNKKELAIVNK